MLSAISGHHLETPAHDGDPVAFFDRSLDTGVLWARSSKGGRVRLPVRHWQARRLPGDLSLLRRCVSPALDIGCGPGRLSAALQTAGIHALGLDISPRAVEQARLAGAAAICRSVFEDLPGIGQWKSVLLADGNVGIGGDPEVLLRRVRSILTPDGAALVEVAGPGQLSQTHLLQLDNGHDTVSGWFSWAQVGIDDISVLAGKAQLDLTSAWTAAGRWFAELTRTPDHETKP